MQIKNKALIYIYLPIHIKALADGLYSLATNPTTNPKATPTIVRMTSRLVLTTSKHFIFVPDRYVYWAWSGRHTYSKWGRRSESLNTEFEIVSSKSVFIMNHKNVIGGSRFSGGGVCNLETSLFFFWFFFFFVNLDSLSFRKLTDSLECFWTCFC